MYVEHTCDYPVRRSPKLSHYDHEEVPEARTAKTLGSSSPVAYAGLETEIIYVKLPPNALTYLGAVEHGARADNIGDDEGVLDSTGIVKKFEGLVAGVDRGDLQVVQSIDLEVSGRGVDGEAGTAEMVTAEARRARRAVRREGDMGGSRRLSR